MAVDTEVQVKEQLNAQHGKNAPTDLSDATKEQDVQDALPPVEYASLADLGGKAPKKNDPYATLRDLIGQRIVLVSVDISDTERNAGTAKVHVMGSDSENLTEITLPKASVAAIARALPRLQGKQLAANVVMGERGIKLE